MAISSRGTMGESGGLPLRATYTSRVTDTGVKTTGKVTKPEKFEQESTSYRGSEMTKGERKKIAEQNKAAESLKSKDLDKSESAQRGAQTRKENQELREDMAHDAGYRKGEKVGTAKGAVATAVVGGTVAAFLHERDDKPKGSQPNHHVTDSKNNTKTVK